jgi:hypothetical protein
LKIRAVIAALTKKTPSKGLPANPDLDVDARVAILSSAIVRPGGAICRYSSREVPR